MSKGFVAAVLTVLLAGGSLLAYAFRLQVDTFAEWNRQLELANAEAEHVRQSIVVPSDQRVRAGEDFAAALQKLGLSWQEAVDATSA
ncbi:MAG TPA: hypothetical protein VN749_19070, partial [Candidatus Eisenbacteria bacterium]|nr:hypothetical protein [Candidatus Eisenbacteria bacterium]